jgi:hypothetical protein
MILARSGFTQLAFAPGIFRGEIPYAMGETDRES